MNLVQAALRRPLTIVVLVIAVCLGAWVAVQRMTRDVFPPLGIPTIYVAQPYGGMDPAQMEGTSLTTTNIISSTSRASNTWSPSRYRERRS